MENLCNVTEDENPFEEECGKSDASLPEPFAANDTVSCDCSFCPDNAVDPKAPAVVIASHDELLNLFKRNMTSYLLKTNERRFIGAIEVVGPIARFNSTPLDYLDSGDELDMFGFGDMDEEETVEGSGEDSDQKKKENLPDEMGMIYMIMKDMVDEELTNPNTKVRILWIFEDVPYNEGAPFVRDAVRAQIPFLNAYNNILLREYVRKGDPLEYGITMYSEEDNFGGSEYQSAGSKMFKPTTGAILGMFSSLALMMPIFSTLVVIVNENSTGNKQLQITMGLHIVIYWIANFVWDFILYGHSLVIMIVFMLCFPDTFNQDMKAYTLLAVLYGLGMIFLGYWLSFVFKTARNCITALGNIAPWFSFAAMILMIFKRDDWYDDVNTRLLFFPPYFITETIVVLEFIDKLPFERDIYSWDIMGKRIAASIFWIICMLVLMICCEAGFFSFLIDKVKSFRNRYSTEAADGKAKDPDVAQEEAVILKGEEQANNVVEVKKLVKYFPNGQKVAVGGVTFGVRKGECFGLLGTNGAGKTTLFNMITGFMAPTEGDANVLGFSVQKRANDVHKHMGYCPQEDVLFERLTPGEHLHLYARIRGVPAPQRDDIVEHLINESGLTPHRTKNANELSGGNKRKLNFAISVTDFPEIIFLDEMTTGLDPEARRAAWNLLLLAVHKGSAAVITSHSMEECEALCNRLVIMVNGRFKCLGGVQYLKDKYGNNYTVKIRLSMSADSKQLFDKISRVFLQANMVEQHLGFLELVVPATQLKLSELFETIHGLKDEFGIEEFSVSQTTLEHVFVNMVKEQHDDVRRLSSKAKASIAR